MEKLEKKKLDSLVNGLQKKVQGLVTTYGMCPVNDDFMTCGISIAIDHINAAFKKNYESNSVKIAKYDDSKPLLKKEKEKPYTSKLSREYDIGPAVSYIPELAVKIFSSKLPKKRFADTKDK